MEELEIKVIDACRKYIDEKKGSYVRARYYKNSTLIECVQSDFPDVLASDFKLKNKVFGSVTMKEGGIEFIDSINDENFSEYIHKEIEK